MNGQTPHSRMETCLDIILSHELFPEGAQPFCGIAPARDTRDFFRHNGLQTVHAPNRLRLVYEAPRHTAPWAEPPEELLFYLFTRDPQLLYYTNLPLPEPGGSLTSVLSGNGLTDFSRIAVERNWQQTARAETDNSGIPFAQVRIEASSLPAPAPLVIHFTARHAFWRYSITMNRPKIYGELSIQSRLCSFLPVGKGNNPPRTRTFESAEAIAMPLSPHKGITLCHHKEGTEEILLNDLPNPRRNSIILEQDNRYIAEACLHL